MTSPKKDKVKVTEKPTVTEEKVARPAPAVEQPGELAEVVNMRNRLDKLLDGHRKVVTSKTADEVSSLRKRLRDMGATDIP